MPSRPIAGSSHFHRRVFLHLNVTKSLGPRLGQHTNINGRQLWLNSLGQRRRHDRRTDFRHFDPLRHAGNALLLPGLEHRARVDVCGRRPRTAPPE